MSNPKSPRRAPSIDRRSLLRYVGFGVTGAAAGPLLGPLARAADAPSKPADRLTDKPAKPVASQPTPSPDRPWVRADGTPEFSPVSYPIPSLGDGGSAANDAQRLASFTVVDDLVLPPGFSYHVITTWGDRLGPAAKPAKQIVAGHNCDYTGLVPLPGRPSEYYLVINHEYISSRPWLQAFNSARKEGPVDLAVLPDDAKKYPDGRLRVAGQLFDGPDVDLEQWLPPAEAMGMADDRRIELLAERSRLPAELFETLREVARAAFEDLGVSVVHVKRSPDGTFAPVVESTRHLRFTGPSNRGPRAKLTGPAATLFPAPSGTFGNCSGATTPWGTFLTCEENYQDYIPDAVASDGSPLDVSCPFGGHLAGGEHTLPFEFKGLGQASQLDIDARGYGWVCEVDPVRGTLTKHTALGRFRHENVALRVEKGKRLTAYLGDDRRGGHVYKFVSDDVVTDPADRANSALLTKGTLHVARLEPGFTGRWIPLKPTTPLARPEPSQTASGHMQLPARPAGGRIEVGAVPGKHAKLSVHRWIASIERFTGKPFGKTVLGDLIEAPPAAARGKSADHTLAVLLTDAFAYANAVGGTPTSRPEDIEVHPRDKSVYISFTDNTGSADGSPDVRIFPDSTGKNSRQYGAIYRLAEDDNDPASLTFTWGKFVTAGEISDRDPKEPKKSPGGFACADNLAFDPHANLWMVCDITTPSHNHPVLRDDKSAAGSKTFPGIFGNNAMFMIPTAGENAGIPFCFATGPMECELTGPTWTDDGRTLILSVQHPGELYGTRQPRSPSATQPPETAREFKLLTRDGKSFMQRRTVPLGSNFPAKSLGALPRSCVVCIVRADSHITQR